VAITYYQKTKMSTLFIASASQQNLRAPLKGEFSGLSAGK